MFDKGPFCVEKELGYRECRCYQRGQVEGKSEDSMWISGRNSLGTIDQYMKNSKRDSVQGTLRWFVPMQEVNMCYLCMTQSKSATDDNVVLAALHVYRLRSNYTGWTEQSLLVFVGTECHFCSNRYNNPFLMCPAKSVGGTATFGGSSATAAFLAALSQFIIEKSEMSWNASKWDSACCGLFMTEFV